MYSKKLLSLLIILSISIACLLPAFAEDFKISNLKFGYGVKEGDLRKITEETTTIKSIGNHEISVNDKMEKSTLIGISFDYEGSVEGAILRMKMPDAGNFYNHEGKTVAENVNFYDYQIKFDKEKGNYIKTIAMLSSDPYGKYTFEIIYKDNILGSVDFDYLPIEKGEFSISNLKFGYAVKDGDKKEITEETTDIKAVGNYETEVNGKMEKTTLTGISFDYKDGVEGVILRIKMPKSGKFYNYKGETVAEDVESYDYPIKFDKERGNYIKTIAMLYSDPYGTYTFEIIHKDKVLGSIEFNYKEK
jgi:hypothetical protein